MSMSTVSNDLRNLKLISTLEELRFKGESDYYVKREAATKTAEILSDYRVKFSTLPLRVFMNDLGNLIIETYTQHQKVKIHVTEDKIFYVQESLKNRIIEFELVTRSSDKVAFLLREFFENNSSKYKIIIKSIDKSREFVSVMFSPLNLKKNSKN